MTTDTSAGELLRGLQDLRIAFESVTERVAKASALNPRDLGVLDVLHAEGPSTPTALAARTGIHPATLTAILGRLERGGRVVRLPDPDDRRSARIAITDETVRMLAAQYEPIDAALLGAFDRMTPADRDRIEHFLSTTAATIADAERSPESHTVASEGFEPPKA